MRASRKGRSDNRDYRIPVLLILGLLILARPGWILLNQYYCSRSPTGKEPVVFRVVNNELALLPSGEISEEQVSYGDLSGIPQYIRPVFFLPVSINQADRELLQTIPGIGPSLSRSIVDFRRKKGEIASYDELLEIRGIGPHTLKTIKKHSIL